MGEQTAEEGEARAKCMPLWYVHHTYLVYVSTVLYVSSVHVSSLNLFLLASSHFTVLPLSLQYSRVSQTVACQKSCLIST